MTNARCLFQHMIFHMCWLLLSATAPALAQSVPELLAQGKLDLLREKLAPGSQGQANFNLFVGREDLNAGLKDMPPEAQTCADTGRIWTAAEWLQSNAKSTRVLMFNENHLVPAARVFVRSQLPRLRALGFTHIGFETFSPDAGKPRALGPADGFYSVEPTFSALVRAARAQGFTLFAYEAAIDPQSTATTEERRAQREQRESENLQRVIREAPAGSRFLIYAGWSHIAEVPLSDFGKTFQWMASRFREQAGIDPLTIDLTGCTYPVSRDQGEDGRVRIENDGVRVDGQYRGAVDAQFVLPAPASGYPDRAGFYRASLGKPVKIPARLHPLGQTVLVEARLLDASANEVAVDRVLLRAGEDLPLYLPSGQYHLSAFFTDGTRAGGTQIKVR